MNNRCVTTAFALAMIAGISASAAVTPMNASITARVYDSEFATIDSLSLTETGQVSIGTVGSFGSLNPDYASAVNIDFSVVTVGLHRTVTLTYSTGGPAFITPDGIGALIELPNGGYYSLTFGIGFSDDEWDGDNTTRSSHASLWGDGLPVANPAIPFYSPSVFLTPGLHGFSDMTSPAEPGFFGAQTVADEMRYVVEYNIVPSPGPFALLALGGLIAVRRR